MFRSFPIFIIPLASLLSSCALLGGTDVRVLKTQFPVVVRSGPEQPPVVRFQKARPGGWAQLQDISKMAMGAVIVSEDWAFYTHKGYDANQIKEAIQEDLAEGKFARGASTITQQVVKNVFLTREKTLTRKAKELYLAVKLEEQVGKKRILETYFNIAEWGDGIYGIGAAARHYFGKEPAQLTAKEGAFLAMLLPSPIRYGQSFRAKELTAYARKTIESILEKMVRAKYLTEDELKAELKTPLSFEKGAENAPAESVRPAGLPPSVVL